MTQTMDLNKMGLAPMDEVEMQEVDGGLSKTAWAIIGIGCGIGAILLSGGAATPAVLGMADALGGMSFCATMLGM